MSQIEQSFRQFLSLYPEVEKCYQAGLINRRSLARHLIRKGVAKNNQLEAVIAMLRRFNFKEPKKESMEIFKDIRVNIKDRILILDFEKDKELMQKLQRLIAHTDYDRGDTLKIVVGSSSIKVFIDQKKEDKLKEIFRQYKLKHRLDNISEISLMFPDKAVDARGILSTITRELAVNDAVITELLTATPELLIYLKEEYVLKAYEIIKRLKE
ncbi:MAG: hypothetical protein KAK00_04760 [Nanoarchaeota archaeon]|nr:hypothetical protein [Nanoarchaeota archaeon]